MSGFTWALLKDDRPSGVALRDLGEHRLKDFPGPEHIYQVAIDGVPADFPALRALAATPSNPALAATPNNLVTQLTRFIGRERELEETKARLLNARLLTISGAGGLGKTRLSIELASSVSQVFNAGVWFIELAGLSDGSLVPHAVATVVGVRESANEPLEVTLSRHLGSLRALIVLDNCEHLVEGCAQLVQVAPPEMPRPHRPCHQQGGPGSSGGGRLAAQPACPAGGRAFGCGRGAPAVRGRCLVRGSSDPGGSVVPTRPAERSPCRRDLLPT